VSQTSSTTTLPSPTSTSKPSNKRKLSFHSSDTCNSEEDHEDTQDKRLVEAIDLVDKLSEKKGKDSKNELWNQCHANLLRDLEKKGTLWRYNHRHLKVWTDLISEGKASGVGEEPNWEEHIAYVNIPPKRKERPNSLASDSSTNADNLLKMMFLQNQQRMEIEDRRSQFLQNSFLSMMVCKVREIYKYFKVREL